MSSKRTPFSPNQWTCAADADAAAATLLIEWARPPVDGRRRRPIKKRPSTERRSKKKNTQMKRWQPPKRKQKKTPAPALIDTNIVLIFHESQKNIKKKKKTNTWNLLVTEERWNEPKIEKPVLLDWLPWRATRFHWRSRRIRENTEKWLQKKKENRYQSNPINGRCNRAISEEINETVASITINR